MAGFVLGIRIGLAQTGPLAAVLPPLLDPPTTVLPAMPVPLPVDPPLVAPPFEVAADPPAPASAEFVLSVVQPATWTMTTSAVTAPANPKNLKLIPMFASSLSAAGVSTPAVKRDIVQPDVVVGPLQQLDLDLSDIRWVDPALEAVRTGPLHQLVPRNQEQLPVLGSGYVGMELVATFVRSWHACRGPRGKDPTVVASGIAERLDRG